MRNRTIIIVVLLALCATALSTAQTASDLYRQGLAREQVGDCEGAIPLYERIVHEFPSNKDREQVATAKLHLGECWIKKTEADQVKGLNYLNDVITQYKDLTDIAREANRIKALMRPAWSERDYLLVAEFKNDTGDAILDNSLRTALIFQLEPSPYLDIFPFTRIRETLVRMRRPEDERVTHTVAQEICGKAGVKGNLLPSIEGSDGHYAITLKVVSCSADGGAIAETKVEAASRKDLLTRLSEAASKLRAALGESPESIVHFAPKTTNSIEALEAYTRGYPRYQAGDWIHAETALANAIKLDPNFASAYALRATIPANDPNANRRSAADAFRLRDRVSEKERLNIEALYQFLVLGDLDKSIDTLEHLRDLYPRDGDIRSLLGNQYRARGFFDKGLKELQEAVNLNPTESVTRESLLRNFMELNKYPEAKSQYKESAVGGFDSASGMHRAVYAMAVVDDDAITAQQQLDWLNVRGGPYLQEMYIVQVQRAELRGERVSARRLTEEQLRGLTNWATKSSTLENEARTEALYGDVDESRILAQSALEQRRAPRQLATALIVYGLIGDAVNVPPLLKEIKENYPENPFMNAVWIPTAMAALEIRKGNPAEAIKLLEPAIGYEPIADSLWAIYVRGLAHLQTKSGRAAAAEFEKIVDHRGVDPLSPLYPVAHLRLAEAYILMGDMSQAGKSYEDFFKLWKTADPSIPILKEAQAKYDALPGNYAGKGESFLILPAVSANSTSSPLVIPAVRPARYGVRTQIVVYDRQQHVLGTVNETGPVPMLSLSPDGSRLAFIRGTDIWVHDIASNKEDRIASNVLTDGPPEWSSNGNRVAYRASRNGAQWLCVKASNGTGNEELIYSPVSTIYNWSKDDRFVAIRTGSNYSVLPMDGEPKPITIRPTSGTSGGLRLAPDGRFAAYLSGESGRNEVYVRSFDPTSVASPGAAVTRKVSTQGSPGLMRWRSDGRELYYLSLDGGVIVVSDVNAAAFNEQSSTLLFHVPDNFPLAASPGPGVYADISADGQRFVFALPAPTATRK